MQIAPTARLLTSITFSLLLMAACAPLADTPAQTEAPTVAVTPTQLDRLTPIPTTEATPVEDQTLTLWLPDKLVPASSGGDVDLLNEQIAAFSASRDSLNVEARRRQVGELGGIMPTLQSAQGVAPGALPDLTLMRRASLQTAVELDLVRPLDSIVAEPELSDFFPAALELGRVGDTLYGLPYALEVQHMIVTTDANRPTDATFETYLDVGGAYLLPAAGTNTLSNTILLQYLAAGGSVSSERVLQMDEDALLAVLSFYEQAMQQGILPPEVLDYDDTDDYQSPLRQGDFSSALVTSQQYLELLEEGIRYPFAPLPTNDGGLITTLDGWMWVVPTEDADGQSRAADFLGWIMEPGRQGEYVRSLNLIPSQRTELDANYEPDYAAFLEDLLPSARLPLTEVAVSAPARAIQGALVAVVSGEQTAEEATADVMQQIED